MTSLQTIFLLIALITGCFAVAKYNKSDNLFWILLISLFAGMAGGAIFTSFGNDDEENTSNFEQVYNPMQVSPANSIDFYAELGDSYAVLAEPAGKDVEIPVIGIEVDRAPSKVYGEIRDQPLYLNPRNKGTPGMPFDTS